MKRWLAGVALTVTALYGAEAFAADCRADREERLARLATAFDEEVKGLHIWSWSWGSIYAAAAVTQAGLAIGLKEQAARLDLGVGSITAAIGSASLFLLPLRFTRPLTQLRSRWSDPYRCGLLAEAEATLERVAKEEGTGKSWVGHAGNIAFNVGLLLVLGLGFGHWRQGLISAGIGAAVGELNLLTQPTNLHRAREGPTVMLVPQLGERTGAALVMAF